MDRRFRAMRSGVWTADVSNSVRLEKQMTRTFKTVPAIALAVALLGGAAEAQIKIGVNEAADGAFAASGTYVVNGAKDRRRRDSMPRAGSSARKSNSSSRTTRAIRRKPLRLPKS